MLLLASGREKRRENLLFLHRHITHVKGKLGLPSVSSPGKVASIWGTPVRALPCSHLCLRSAWGGGAECTERV